MIEMSSTSAEFQLSAVLEGHEQDVRCIGLTAVGEVLTGSRDVSEVDETTA